MSRKNAIEQATAYIEYRARDSIRGLEEAVQAIDNAVEAVKSGDAFKCFTFARQAAEMWCIALSAWFGEPTIRNNDTVLFWGAEQVGCHILMEVGEDAHLHIHILAPEVMATCKEFNNRREGLIEAERLGAMPEEFIRKNSCKVRL